MVEVNVRFPLPLPDDPNKWNGWTKYKSPNFYERLCLDPRNSRADELIEGHCRELLRWWQKKLPLKNQPSNPLAQLLRPGLDESSRYLTEARVELLDPQRRQRLDEELRGAGAGTGDRRISQVSDLRARRRSPAARRRKRIFCVSAASTS